MIMINTLILQAPAETTRYLVAGYTVIFGIILLYVVSLIVRSRNLKREIETLKQLDEEKK
jgi:CcmD family protein